MSRMSSSLAFLTQVLLRIRQRLIKRAADFGILLDDVAITHLNFSPEYEKALRRLLVHVGHPAQAGKASAWPKSTQIARHRVNERIFVEGEWRNGA